MPVHTAKEKAKNRRIKKAADKKKLKKNTGHTFE